MAVAASLEKLMARTSTESTGGAHHDNQRAVMVG